MLSFLSNIEEDDKEVNNADDNLLDVQIHTRRNLYVYQLAYNSREPNLSNSIGIPLSAQSAQRRRHASIDDHISVQYRSWV